MISYRKAQRQERIALRNKRREEVAAGVPYEHLSKPNTRCGVPRDVGQPKRFEEDCVYLLRYIHSLIFSPRQYMQPQYLPIFGRRRIHGQQDINPEYETKLIKEIAANIKILMGGKRVTKFLKRGFSIERLIKFHFFARYVRRFDQPHFPFRETRLCELFDRRQTGDIGIAFVVRAHAGEIYQMWPAGEIRFMQAFLYCIHLTASMLKHVQFHIVQEPSFRHMHSAIQLFEIVAAGIPHKEWMNQSWGASSWFKPEIQEEIFTRPRYDWEHSSLYYVMMGGHRSLAMKNVPDWKDYYERVEEEKSDNDNF